VWLVCGYCSHSLITKMCLKPSHVHAAYLIEIWMILQGDGVSREEDQEREEAPPPSVPFFRLFEHADALDWTLMIVGSAAAAVHGAALPAYLYVLGRIVNLFGIYQHDMTVHHGKHLSSHNIYSLADELSKVEQNPSISVPVGSC
jgi:hypothetical protein